MRRKYLWIGLIAIALMTTGIRNSTATGAGSREECERRCETRVAECFDFCSGPLVDRCERYCSYRDDPEDCLRACDSVEAACNRSCEFKEKFCGLICERLFPESPTDP